MSFDRLHRLICSMALLPALAAFGCAGQGAVPAPGTAPDPQVSPTFANKPLPASETPLGNWPQWRGPLGDGTAVGANPPVTWSEERNVRWRVEIPGKGLASPIVWGDTLYLTTAVPVGEAAAPPPEDEAEEEDGQQRRRRMPSIDADQLLRFEVLALDRATGEIRWRRTALEAKPHEGTHGDASWASASPVTDGEHLLAHFGSQGLYCYSMDGELHWSTDLGDMRTRNAFGEGSSPALYGDVVVVNWDHEDESFIVALDKSTGEELWRRQRDEPTSWSTPLVYEHDGQAQVVVAATNATRAYELRTGATVWELGGMTLNVIPSPIYRQGMIYVMSGFRGNAAQAIRLDGARGDLSASDRVAWSYDRDTPYVPSPVLYDDTLYFLKHNRGILTALDAATGELRYGPERLEGVEGAYAGLVAAAGRVYVTGRNGVTAVVRHGDSFEVLATNELDDRFDASPAIVGSELYLRGHRYLYRIEESG